jgi:hypothetical protein
MARLSISDVGGLECAAPARMFPPAGYGVLPRENRPVSVAPLKDENRINSIGPERPQALGHAGAAEALAPPSAEAQGLLNLKASRPAALRR